MHQRDEHLSLPAALLPQVAPDCGEAYLVALLDELAMDPGAAARRCLAVVLPRHSARISSTLGAIVSITGEGFLWRATLTGSETFRYFLMVLRLMDIWRETERILWPSTKILCRTTCT
jgi:hypothetical protein